MTTIPSQVNAAFSLASTPGESSARENRYGALLPFEKSINGIFN